MIVALAAPGDPGLALALRLRAYFDFFHAVGARGLFIGKNRPALVIVVAINLGRCRREQHEQAQTEQNPGHKGSLSC